MKVRETPNTTRPVSGHHRSANETPLFRWGADDDPTLNAGLVAL